jgi:anti-sigma factor RsiW
MSVENHDLTQVGAYAMGLLDDEQARAVEEHLASCESCRREHEELRRMTELLDELPPEAFLEGPPENDLVLRRAVREIRDERGRRLLRRRLTVGLLAAAAVVVFAFGGLAIGRATAPAPTPALAAGTVAMDGTGASGVTMHASVSPAADWVRVAVTVKGIPPGEHCRVYVIRHDGTREIAGSWLTGPASESRGVTLDGAADVAVGDVAGIEVANTSGRSFVSAVT